MVVKKGLRVSQGRLYFPIISRCDFAKSQSKRKRSALLVRFLMSAVPPILYVTPENV